MNLPYLGKVLWRVVVGQLQALLDEMDFLDPFQLGFRPGFGMETALVALKEIRGMACRQRAFSAAAPRLWNTIPIEIHLAPTLMIFWRQVKNSCSRRLLIEIISTVGPDGNF